MHIALYAKHGAVEDRKNKLVKDLRGVVADTDDLLQEVANASGEEFAAARAKIEARLRQARSRLDHARIAVARKACDAAEAGHEYARENPWKAFGLPALGGLVVFILLSRR